MTCTALNLQYMITFDSVARLQAGTHACRYDYVTTGYSWQLSVSPTQSKTLIYAAQQRAL